MQAYKELDQENEDSDARIVEVDPSGRYGRYKEVLGKGAFKKVYRAFDGLEGIEVAWNQVKLTDVLCRHENLESLYSEVHLLKTLNHKSIIKLYCSWVDVACKNINFITELFTSGTLRQYRQKYKHVDLRALKKWSRQILEGLMYLHGQIPPVIHRDLKCDNIFVNGNQGEVKIGDLGLAAILHQASTAHSIIGTPEFMAPEFYDEEYDELVDVYAFGMCLLELVTLEYPYSECSNAAQIYKKVTSGIKPAALAKVSDPGLRAFIEKCIAKSSNRLPAKDLLNDDFLLSSSELGNESHPLPTKYLNGDCLAERSPFEEGQAEDLNTVFVNLRIADSKGNFRLIHFPFDIQKDTPLSVAREMVEELDLTGKDITAIAKMIDSEICLRSTWCAPTSPIEENCPPMDRGMPMAETRDARRVANNDAAASGNVILRRMPSGRIYWSSSLDTANNDFLAESACLDPPPKVDITTPGTKECMRHPDGKRSIEPSTSSSPPMWINGREPDHPDASDEDEALAGKKLEHLMMKQREEAQELRRKHEAEIRKTVEGLIPEVREKVMAKYDVRRVVPPTAQMGPSFTLP
ncbi:hypothetical protein MLD38_026104 [Melastoma candidum]|uniref:Uncharacterized protein n=1 Tax=Melastoma candidum TaxID=119954 RepID=A0ACB9P0P7_9MYRT|nr:hypothetical protein MLD38_026104 [Melastoma candidum]